MDHWKTPFSVGFSVVVSDGADLVFAVENTFDNVEDPNVTPVWWPHPTGIGAVNVTGSYTFPFTAIRLTVEENGTGTATLTFVQAG
jgi:hypothetical protein